MFYAWRRQTDSMRKGSTALDWETHGSAAQHRTPPHLHLLLTHETVDSVEQGIMVFQGYTLSCLTRSIGCQHGIYSTPAHKLLTEGKWCVE